MRTHAPRFPVRQRGPAHVVLDALAEVHVLQRRARGFQRLHHVDEHLRGCLVDLFKAAACQHVSARRMPLRSSYLKHMQCNLCLQWLYTKSEQQCRAPAWCRLHPKHTC
jgi:hypothetical protein